MDIEFLSNLYVCFAQKSCEVGIISYAIVDGLCLRILAGLFTEYC